MNDARFDSQIKQDEGDVLTVYADSRGNPTVGIGHKVLDEDGLYIGDTITEQESQAFYDADKAIAIAGAMKLCPGYSTWPDDAQEALVNMIFNMGVGTVGSLTDTLALMNAQNWPAVSAYLKSPAYAKWQSQVGQRAFRIADLFGSAGGIAVSAIVVLAIGYFAAKYYKII